MFIGQPREQPLVMRADTARLVERELFLDGDVHAEVQERIGRFRGHLRVPGEVKSRLRLRPAPDLQQRVVFRVPERHRHDQRLDAFERQVFSMPAAQARKNTSRVW